MSTHTASSRKSNGIAEAFSKTPWLPTVLVVGLGGAVYMLLNIFVLHYALENFEDGSLIDPQAKSNLFGPTVIFLLLLFIGPVLRQWRNPNEARTIDMQGGFILAFIVSLIVIAIPCPANIAALYTVIGGSSIAAYHILNFYSNFPSIKLMVLFVWWIAYFAIWIVGVPAPISLPMFIVIWAAIGFGGGLLIYTMLRGKVQENYDDEQSFERKSAQAQTYAQGVAQTRRRAARTSGTLSRYGRIPQDTVDLLTNHIRRITGPIVAALPVGSSVQRRNETVHILLETVICDWRENDNFDLMTPEDIDDFQSFIEAASFLSDGEETETKISIYRVTLKALARDWLENWNATSNSGPPDRVY